MKLTSLFRSNTQYLSVDFSEDLGSFFLENSGNRSDLSTLKRNAVFLLIHTGRCGSTLIHHFFLNKNVCPPFEIYNYSASKEFIDSSNIKVPIDIYKYTNTYAAEMLSNVVPPDIGLVSFSVTPWCLAWLVQHHSPFLKDLLDGASVCFLNRRNVIEQALSYSLAEKSNEWHNFRENTEIAEVKFHEIQDTFFEFLDLILWGENYMWNFAQTDILSKSASVFSGSYETVSNDLYALLMKIGIDLGIPIPVGSETSFKNLPIKTARYQEMLPFALEKLPYTLPSGIQFTQDMLISRSLEF